MQFSSKTPRDLNRDPEPYACGMKRLGDLRHEESEVWACLTPLHDPRPEFDHVQHNPPNPLLTLFREAGFDGDMRGWSMWLFLASVDSDFCTREHYEHAKKVLTRLANLMEESA